MASRDEQASQDLMLKLHGTVVPLLAAGGTPTQALAAIVRECPEVISDLPQEWFANETLRNFLASRPVSGAVN